MNRQQRRSLKPDPWQAALATHQAGNLAEAERLYRRLLAADPRHGLALSNLGVALFQQGRHAESIAVSRRALALRPDAPQVMLNLAEALRASGELSAATEAYRDAIARLPPSATLANVLGTVLAEAGQLAEAAEVLRGALAIDPDIAHIHRNLGGVLLRDGKLAEAIAVLRAGQARHPEAAELLSDLTYALIAAGEPEAAVVTGQAARRLAPQMVSAHLNLASALDALDRLEEALAVSEAAVALAPEDADTHSSAAGYGLKLGRFAEAAAAAKRALELRPGHREARTNRALALTQLGELEDAAAVLRAALVIDPLHAAAEFTLGQTLLALGDFPAGLRHLEARWRSDARVSHFNGLIDAPLWQGQPLAGQSLLLHHEQGFGDTLQMLRFLPMVVARGAQVVLLVQSALQGLVPAQPGVTVVPEPETLPPFDLHCPLFSLPRVLGVTPASLGGAGPYLRADPAAVAAWRSRLGPAQQGRLRVGLVWAGNPAFRGDRFRSLPAAVLAPLLAAGGVEFFSFQRDQKPDDATWLAGPGAAITPLGPALTDFGETAAALSNMDLLISSDTSVCHLAGALGLPVWLMLGFAPDWRWAMDGEVSSWYPSMRLLRQPAPGDWPGLLGRVAGMLAARAGG